MATIVAGLALAWPGIRDGVRLAAGEPQQPRTGERSNKDGATELGKLAAALKRGAWAELNTKGYTADLLKAQLRNGVRQSPQVNRPQLPLIAGRI